MKTTRPCRNSTWPSSRFPISTGFFGGSDVCCIEKVCKDLKQETKKQQAQIKELETVCPSFFFFFLNASLDRS